MTSPALEIQVDKDLDPSDSSSASSSSITYVSGETIHGKISLNNQIFYDSDNEYELKLQVLGRERCKVRMGRKAERILLKANMVLFSGSVKDDWRDLKFRFKLPDNLPTSLRRESSGGSYSEIAYVLRAILEPTKPNRKSSFRQLQSAVSAQRQFFVRAAPIPPIVVPFIAEPKSHVVKTFSVKVSF